MKKLLIPLLVLSANLLTFANIKISNTNGSDTSNFATAQLKEYLNLLYDDEKFVLARANGDIELILSETCAEKYPHIKNLPSKKESYNIVEDNGKLLIIGHDKKAILNATYALIEKADVGFYINGDAIPKPKKWQGFENFVQQDEPLFDDRFLFNWHNFISGCTGWGYEDWVRWIDQANKMRYNGIMIHAYGNNPMFSYEYLNEKKDTGMMNNSASGRDWGNQHISDVRKMKGGDIFETAIFGAKPSLAKGDEQIKEITKMMHDAFDYAKMTGCSIKFAIDFDTWMSNPQNIVKKLPKEALFNINGKLTPNPEHPEGYKYYKHQIKSLLKMYPQVDELVAWSRTPSNKTSPTLGSIWMTFSYEKFPQDWKNQYDKILKENPNLKKNLQTQGIFAFSKIVTALQKAGKKIKPSLKISYGSWNTNWLSLADKFLPKNVTIYPLEQNFDKEKSGDNIKAVKSGRKINPIMWAHHDDYAYIGRPFTPNPNLTEQLYDRGISGLGIIHWTTHPLDLFFANTAKQLWKTTANQPLQTTIDAYVQSKFSIKSNELSAYYYDWLTKGPTFGRETSDHFIDLGRKLHWDSKFESWKQLINEHKLRSKLVKQVPENLKNDYWRYQEKMEEFYISFFLNQDKFVDALELTRKGKLEEAREILETTDPLNTIQLYVDALKFIEPSSGEKALVISLNSRWYIDFINLRQSAGIENVYIKFTPTYHDKLAANAGKFTYYVENEQKWWVCYWKKEFPKLKFANNAMLVDSEQKFPLKTMHSNPLPTKEYEITLDFSGDIDAEIEMNSKIIPTEVVSKSDNKMSIKFKGGGKNLYLKLNSKSKGYLKSITIK